LRLDELNRYLSRGLASPFALEALEDRAAPRQHRASISRDPRSRDADPRGVAQER
jgi:hypothetical protein